MPGMNLRPYRAVLAVPLTTLAIVAAIPTSSQAAARPVAHAKQTKNANFKGHWHMSNGRDFTVKKENPKTGKCKGTTSLGPPYEFAACKVTGNHFHFRISYGPNAEVTYYSGTFTKHSLHGQWRNQGGSTGVYTATRHSTKVK
jgi:hypothetical protein